MTSFEFVFQRIYKGQITGNYIPVYVAMSARKRRSPPEGGSDPKGVRAPELDTCEETVNPAFKPDRAVLRRLFHNPRKEQIYFGGIVLKKKSSAIS
jgi:hypothetical protein